MPGRGVQPLGFRKPAGNQPRRELPFEAHALLAGQDVRPFRDLHAAMAKRLVEPERVHEHLPCPAAQRGGDLAGQQRRGGTGDEHLHGFGIQQPTHETLPAGRQLDLVEAPHDRRSARSRGRKALVFVEEQVQMATLQSGEPLVLERNTGRPGRVCARRQELLPQLVQEGGLAGPAHADPRGRLAREPHKPVHAAGGMGGRRRLYGAGDLFGQHLPKGCRDCFQDPLFSF